MVVPLAMEGGEICTGQIILQPITLESDRLLTSRFKRAKKNGNPKVAVLIYCDYRVSKPVTAA